MYGDKGAINFNLPAGPDDPQEPDAPRPQERTIIQDSSQPPPPPQGLGQAQPLTFGGGRAQPAFSGFSTEQFTGGFTTGVTGIHDATAAMNWPKAPRKSGFSLGTALAIIILTAVVAGGGMVVLNWQTMGPGIVALLTGTVPQQQLPPAPAPAPVTAVQPMAKPEPIQPSGPPENPYWSLPNELVDVPGAGRGWRGEEKQLWQDGLANTFVYQRYRTVEEVRRERLAGSEEILWAALDEKKFWTRMSAAAGLAEMGIPLTTTDVARALGNARPDLVANYFKRFEQGATGGELYLLRQALRLVDGPARAQALRAIAQSRDTMRDLYLTAALYDPSPRVKRMLTQELAARPVDQKRMEQHRRVVLGGASMHSDLTSLDKAVLTSPVREAAQSVQAQAVPEPAATSPDGVKFGRIQFFNRDQDLAAPAEGFRPVEVIELSR